MTCCFAALSRNNQLENESYKLKAELDALKPNYVRASDQNLRFRFDVEKIATERDNIFEAHQKQKLMLTEYKNAKSFDRTPTYFLSFRLMKKHTSQFRQLKKLEEIIAINHDNLLPYAEIFTKRRPVTVIGKTILFILSLKLHVVSHLNKNRIRERHTSR